MKREVNSSLSGGEMKRIEIAMIMAKETNLYVFDEPEAGIDIWSFNNLISVFQKMREKNNKSMLVISHQDRIMNIEDEIVVIEDGKIKSHDKAEDLLPCLLNRANKPCCKKAGGEITWKK